MSILSPWFAIMITVPRKLTEIYFCKIICSKDVTLVWINVDLSCYSHMHKKVTLLKTKLKIVRLYRHSLCSRQKAAHSARWAFLFRLVFSGTSFCIKSLVLSKEYEVKMCYQLSILSVEAFISCSDDQRVFLCCLALIGFKGFYLLFQMWHLQRLSDGLTPACQGRNQTCRESPSPS